MGQVTVAGMNSTCPVEFTVYPDRDLNSDSRSMNGMTRADRDLNSDLQSMYSMTGTDGPEQ